MGKTALTLHSKGNNNKDQVNVKIFEYINSFSCWNLLGPENSNITSLISFLLEFEPAL